MRKCILSEEGPALPGERGSLSHDAPEPEPGTPLLLLLLHAAATGVMTGLIWFVQVVHYPLFAHVGQAGFAAYAREHQRRTTWVVALPMLLEAGTAVLLALRPPAGVPPALAWTGLALVGVVWASTLGLQVPEHGRLAGGFDAVGARRLVRGNWVRTVAWTLRGVLVLRMLALAAPGAAG